MTIAASRPATYADILALPDHLVGEIMNGDLVVSPRPAPAHAVASSALSATLLPPLQFGEGGSGGWWVIFEPELHLGEDILVPDLAAWRRERMAKLPADPFFSLVPDWVCEVLSPTTGRTDRTKKLPAYASAAVQYLWLLDPLAQTLEVYRLEARHWVLLGAHGGDDIVRAVPFEDVEVRLARIWA